MTGLGYNVDPFADVDLLVETLRRNPAPLCVVQNNLQIAERLRREFPTMRVVYRITTQDDPDDNAQRHFTPERYLGRAINMGSFAEAARMGAYIYVNNEPEWSQSLDWCRQVGQLIVDRGWRGILGNWSVGVPEPEQVSEADALFRLAHVHRGRIILGFHEYFPYGYAAYDVIGANIRPFVEWPTAAPADSYLLGRMRRALAYCRSKGYRVEAAITEYGSDTVHAAGDMRAVAWANTTDRFGWQLAKLRYPAWHNLGLKDSETLYAKSLAWGWKTFYQPWHEVIGAAFFCFGRSGDWHFYDVSDNRYLLELISKESFNMSTAPTGTTHTIVSPGSTLAKARVTMAGGALLNVRALPHTGATIVNKLRTGDEITYYTDSRATNTGATIYEWRRLESGHWIAKVPELGLAEINTDVETILTHLESAQRELLEAEQIMRLMR